MFLFLLKNKKRKHRKRRVSEDKSKRYKDNSRLIYHKRHKNEAVRNDDFLKSSDKRKKHLFEALRTDGSLVQMRSLPSTDRSGRTQIRTHFLQAQKTPVCIRRDIRRRVLFARGLAGKIKVKRAKWTEDSKIVCK